MLSIGLAFGGQWLFNKFFNKEDKKPQSEKVENMPDSLRIDTLNNSMQKQR